MSPLSLSAEKFETGECSDKMRESLPVDGCFFFTTKMKIVSGLERHAILNTDKAARVTGARERSDGNR